MWAVGWCGLVATAHHHWGRHRPASPIAHCLAKSGSGTSLDLSTTHSPALSCHWISYWSFYLDLSSCLGEWSLVTLEKTTVWLCWQFDQKLKLEIFQKSNHDTVDVVRPGLDQVKINEKFRIFYWNLYKLGQKICTTSYKEMSGRLKWIIFR